MRQRDIHGTESCYRNGGCRCAECKAAACAARKQRRLANPDPPPRELTADEAAVRPKTRKEWHAAIAPLRDAGVPHADIAFRFGIRKSYVKDILCDPDGAKRRGRKLKNSIPCVECGGPSFGLTGSGKRRRKRNNRNKTGRCRYCLEGKGRRNPYLPPVDAPTRTVTLQDVTLKQRLAGAWQACCETDEIAVRYELLALALWPTNDQFEIRAAA